MSAVLSALTLAVVTGIVASVMSRLSARSPGLGLCVAGQLGSMLLRLACLVAVAFLIHIRWPADLVISLGVAVVVVLIGLALDVRHLLGTVRTPQERVRA